MTNAQFQENMTAMMNQFMAAMQAKAPAVEVPAAKSAKVKSSKPASVKSAPKAKSSKSAPKVKPAKAAKPAVPELNAIEKLTHDDTSEEHFYGTESAAIAYTESGPYAGNVRIAVDGKGRPWSHKAENMIRLMQAIEELGGTATVRTICEQAIAGNPENHK